LPDVVLTASPPRGELIPQVASRLGDLVPRCRTLAENLLGAGSRIDFVVADPEGRAALVLVADPGEDLAAVARGIAQRAWVQARLTDWLQLAPDLGVRPEAGIGVWLVCDSIQAETREAVEALGPDGPRLATYRAVRSAAGLAVLLEPHGSAGPLGEPARAGNPSPEPQAEIDEAAIALPPFRTGLRDSDLGITPLERSELQAPPGPLGGRIPPSG
jgi:hypothetical protein